MMQTDKLAELGGTELSIGFSYENDKLSVVSNQQETITIDHVEV